MKRNGFTLVEILAVLIILGILIALSIPAYINVFSSIKRDNFNAKVTEVETAANKMGEKIKDEVKDAGKNCMTKSISELISKGYLLSESEYDNVIYSPTDNTAMLGEIKICYCSTTYNIQSYYVVEFDASKNYYKGDKVKVENEIYKDGKTVTETKIYKCNHDYPGKNLGVDATFKAKTDKNGNLIDDYNKDDTEKNTKTMSYFEELTC